MGSVRSAGRFVFVCGVRSYERFSLDFRYLPGRIVRGLDVCDILGGCRRTEAKEREWPRTPAPTVRLIWDGDGFVELVAIEDDTAYLRFGGGCQGCGMINVTLKQGVEKVLFEDVPEIKKVMDVTDHASGSNPYYQPAK